MRASRRACDVHARRARARAVPSSPARARVCDAPRPRSNPHPSWHAGARARGGYRPVVTLGVGSFHREETQRPNVFGAWRVRGASIGRWSTRTSTTYTHDACRRHKYRATEPRGGGPFGRSFGRGRRRTTDDGRRTTDDGRGRPRRRGKTLKTVARGKTRSSRSDVAARCRWTVTM